MDAGWLDEAVTLQLAGRYLRERDQRHGVLTVVHKRFRPTGWKGENGTFLNFREVIERLKALAYRLGAGGAELARVEIGVIDVSDVAVVPARALRSKKRTAKNPKQRES